MSGPNRVQAEYEAFTPCQNKTVFVRSRQGIRLDILYRAYCLITTSCMAESKKYNPDQISAFFRKSWDKIKKKNVFFEKKNSHLFPFILNKKNLKKIIILRAVMRLRNLAKSDLIFHFWSSFTYSSNVVPFFFLCETRIKQTKQLFYNI